MLLRTFFAALLLACLCASHAQHEAPLRFQRVEGLSQSTGYSIMKDQQGFLWIATANGLNRYDGMEMKVYKPALEKKKGFMQGRIIRSNLLQDAQEQIWFSTDLTVHCFDKKKEEFRTYDLSDKKAHISLGGGTPGNKIFANPLFLKNDHLWLASATAGLFDLDTKTKGYVNYPLVLKDEVGNDIPLMYNGAYDGKNQIWFASRKGLLSFNTLNKQWKQYLQDKSCYTLSICRDTVFVSENNEIVWFDLKSSQYGYANFNEQGSEIKRDRILRVYTDAKLDTWAGDEKGNVYLKSSHSADFKWMGNINSNGTVRTNYPAYCFFSDTSGILWVGAYMLGILKTEVTPKQFSMHPRPAANGVNENLFVNSIHEDEADKVWLGTFEKGIVILNKKTGETAPLKLPYTGPKLPYGNSVPLIRSDSKGNLWTSISGYLFVREKGSAHFFPIKMPAPSNALQVPQLWSLSEYKQGWLLGTNTGLYFLSKQNNSYFIKHLPSFGQKKVYHTWIRNDNEIWIAFESGGVTIAKDIEKPGESSGLFAETNVKSILPDEKHQLLWLSTSNGLIAYHLPSGKYKNFTEEDGLLNSYIYAVVADANELWVSTNYGLSRASLSFENNSVLPTVRFSNFTSTEGLPDNQFNAGAFYKGESGCLYFGTPKGVAWFNPDKIKTKQPIPVMRMINLLVNEEKADSTTSPEYIRQLSLPYFKNSLFFRFRGIAYGNAAKIQYAYKLEGWDKHWVHSGTLNEVRYNNLPHGNYSFKVKAANDSGQWSEEVYTVSITIFPPFWRTWWFYLIAGMIVLAVAVVITKSLAQRKLRQQLREMEKQRAVDAERNRISKDMHDEIGSGLTHIALMGELMQTQKKADAEIRKEVGNISTSARKLVEGMGEIIWALNPQNDTLENLLAYLREQTLTYFEPFAIDYDVHFPEEVPVVKLSNEQRRNLFLVGKEALHNALKHAGADKISLTMEMKSSALHFYISDNGRGFNKDRVRVASNGLKNMRRRMEDIGGFFIINTSSAGTFIHFSLPLSTASKSPGTTFFTSPKKH